VSIGVAERHRSIERNIERDLERKGGDRMRTRTSAPGCRFARAAAVLVLLATVPLAATERRTPQGVTPGARDEVLVSERSCPTFSWSVPAELEHRVSELELRVVSAGGIAADGVARAEVGSDSADDSGDDSADDATGASVVFDVRLPGGARSWTPSAERCLERGGMYGWYVRALVAPQPPRQSSAASRLPARRSSGLSLERTAWSDANLFRVAAEPADSEVAWALDVLRRHLDSEDAVPISTTLSTSSSTTPSTAPSTTPATTPAKMPTSYVREGSPGDAPPPLVSIAGVLQANALHAGEVTSQGDVAFLDQVSAAGLTPSGGLTLWNDDGSAVLSTQANLDAGTGEPDGILYLGTLKTTEQLAVGPQGLEVAKGGWDPGGGDGFGSVPVVFTVGFNYNIVVDDNPSICPDGSIAVGMRLAETDADQLGIQVRCTRRP
jgi:hypothetical protein